MQPKTQPQGPTVLGIRVRQDERDLIEKAARASGQPQPSVWARGILLDAARWALKQQQASTSATSEASRDA
jgi:uncharacterized protein (DUF1778 family)